MPITGFVSGCLGNFVPYIGPGDIVPGALAFWGLRAYSQASMGQVAITLRRDSDNGLQDFRMLGNGHLDVAAITTFKAAANLFVRTLHDQVGTNDFVQTTNANQPQFILNGFGANPVMRFVKASSLGLITLNAIADTQPFSWSAVAKRTGSTTLQNTILGDANVEFYFNNAANQLAMFAGTTQTIAGTDGIFHSLNGVFNGANSIFNVDGINSTVSPGANAMGGTMDLGSGDTLTNPCDADILGASVWTSALTAQNLIDLHGNQGAFWGF